MYGHESSVGLPVTGAAILVVGSQVDWLRPVSAGIVLAILAVGIILAIRRSRR